MNPHPLARLRFALQNRTLKKLALHPENKGKIRVYHAGRTLEIPRRCPHQGAPLEKGKVKDGRLVCPWHGCYYDLKDGTKFCPQRFAPNKSKTQAT